MTDPRDMLPRSGGRTNATATGRRSTRAGRSSRIRRSPCACRRRWRAAASVPHVSGLLPVILFLAGRRRVAGWLDLSAQDRADGADDAVALKAMKRKVHRISIAAEKLAKGRAQRAAAKAHKAELEAPAHGLFPRRPATGRSASFRRMDLSLK